MSPWNRQFRLKGAELDQETQLERINEYIKWRLDKGMASDILTKRLEKLSDFIERDNTIKRHQEKLNKDISEFVQGDLGFGDRPATLIDIVKKALESTIEPSRIIAP